MAYDDPIDKLKAFGLSEEELDEAQAQRLAKLKQISMIGGANKIAESIASGYGGQAPSPDLSMLKTLADQPVKDIYEKIKLLNRKVPNATFKDMTIIDPETGKPKTILYNTKDPSQQMDAAGIKAAEVRKEKDVESKVGARKTAEQVKTSEDLKKQDIESKIGSRLTEAQVKKEQERKAKKLDLDEKNITSQVTSREAGTERTKTQTKNIKLDIQEKEDLKNPLIGKALSVKLNARGIDTSGMNTTQMSELYKTTKDVKYDKVTTLDSKGMPVYAYVNSIDPNDKIVTDIVDVKEKLDREKFDYKKEDDIKDRDHEIAVVKLKQRQAESAKSDKERTDIAKENRKQLQDVIKDTASLNDMKRKLTTAKQIFDDYTKQSIGGTGPLATVGGLKSIVSEDLSNLENAFNDITVEKIAEMFQGMSKAIDSDSERRFFEKSQLSIKVDDAINKRILDERLQAIDKLIQRSQVQHEYLSNNDSADKIRTNAGS